MVRSAIELTSSHHVRLGDVHYDIEIQRSGTAHRATWACCSCGRMLKVDPLMGWTGDDAFDRAYERIQRHHNLAHPGSDDRCPSDQELPLAS